MGVGGPIYNGFFLLTKLTKVWYETVISKLLPEFLSYSCLIDIFGIMSFSVLSFGIGYM